MQFYFIRHAQSANNALWAETGSDVGRSEDPDLTELGMCQALRLAEFLRDGGPKTPLRNRPPSADGPPPGVGLTHLYSSLMLRSVRTGSILAERLGLALRAWEELHERGGIYLRDAQTGEIRCLPGKDRRFFERHFPGLVLPAEFRERGWWDLRAHETPADCARRARRVLSGLLERHGGTDDRVAVVSHGGFYNDFLGSLLNTGEDEVWFSMDNTAVTRVDFFDGMVKFVYQNRVDHLPGEMIT